jgi:alkylation response protein AidB-like acyl-CoA dehydrogenase
MEFAFTAGEQASRKDIRQLLRDRPPETFPHEGMDAGYGSGAHAHAFMRQLGARGWLSMCRPRAYGGQERPVSVDQYRNGYRGVAHALLP